jgi:hypothetical protein
MTVAEKTGPPGTLADALGTTEPLATHRATADIIHAYVARMAGRPLCPAFLAARRPGPLASGRLGRQAQ